MGYETYVSTDGEAMWKRLQDLSDEEETDMTMDDDEEDDWGGEDE